MKAINEHAKAKGFVRLGDSTSHWGDGHHGVRHLEDTREDYGLGRRHDNFPKLQRQFPDPAVCCDRKHRRKIVAYDSDEVVCGAELILSI